MCSTMMLGASSGRNANSTYLSKTNSIYFLLKVFLLLPRDNVYTMVL